MLFTIKNRDDLEKLEELDSLKNQVDKLRLQHKLGKQNFHGAMKKFCELLTDTFKNTSEDLTKTMMSSSEQNSRALEKLNDKLLEIMNDRGVIASYLMSSLT